MSAIDRALLDLTPGFSDAVKGSQAVFRTVLQAMSRPGRIQAVHCDAQVPAEAHPAAAAVLLALLDQDCTLWLSPRLARSSAGVYLRFHTGCCLVDTPAQAQFAWVAGGDEFPVLATLAAGSEFEPEDSATCIAQVDSLDDATGWVLRGPGVQGVQHLAVRGLPQDFPDQWLANHTRFPLGVDLLLTAGDRLAGLPRSTSLEA